MRVGVRMMMVAIGLGTSIHSKGQCMRVDNWPAKLNKYITANRDNQWEMGVHDCCTFAAGAVKAITGEDHMKEFRGKYNTPENSDEALTTIGDGDLYRTLAKKFGKPVHGAMGQKGDVAFHEGCCGIVIGKYGMFIGEHAPGYALIPINQLRRAFRVT